MNKFIPFIAALAVAIAKQGNHTLSTRLFQPSFFEHQQDLDHQLMP